MIDHLTRALVGLYEEPNKPNNSIDYIKEHLGGPSLVDKGKMRQ